MRAVRQQQFEYAYIFGAVRSETAETEALIAPCLNKEVMKERLSLISERTEEGRYAVVIVDGAAWHQESVADEFANLTLIKLPPYSPALNPIEQA